MRDILELIGATLFVTVLFLILADTKITFSPFSFKCLHLLRAVGWVTISIGVSFIVTDTSKTRYKEGVKDGAEYTIQEVNRMFQAATNSDSIDELSVDIEQDMEDENQEPSNLDK